MEIFALANEGLPIPKRSEIQGKFKTSSPSYLKWLVPLVVIGLIGILVLQASYFSSPEKEGRSEGIKELSIAVLPFKDLSPAGDQEYFSDGISEELLNLLTKVNNLKVASRTSSFVFKQQDRNIQDIAKLLEVEYVLEGSVRKAEDQIRITAQLIDTKTDRHIWSENYDRKLEDIFALQDELAGAIVKEINQLVGNDANQELPKLEISTSNLDAYDLLLRAMNLPGEEDERKADVRIELAQKATALDPEYIDAWYTLSAFYISRSNWVFYGKDEIDSLLNQADEALQEVIKINPADKDIPNLKAWLAFSRYELDSTYQLLTTYSEELESSFAQQILAQTYLAVGYLEESTQQYSLLIEEFNPNLPFPWATAGLAYCAYGEYEKAETHFIRARELGYPQFLEYQLIDVYQQMNRPASIRLMAANWPFDSDSDSLQAMIPYRADVLVADSNHKAEALKRFWVVARELGLEQHVKSMSGREMNVYFESGLPNFDVQNQPSMQLGWVWAPYLKNYRKTEAFKAYIREANVLAFWQKHGFPPQCKDLGNGDFVCD
ncbi:MAG: FlgO family outer membrane protein [Bacteroidota bacterium]